MTLRMALFLNYKGGERGGTGLCHNVFWLSEAEPKNIMTRQKMIYSMYGGDTSAKKSSDTDIGHIICFYEDQYGTVCKELAAELPLLPKATFYHQICYAVYC